MTPVDIPEGQGDLAILPLSLRRLYPLGLSMTIAAVDFLHLTGRMKIYHTMPNAILSFRSLYPDGVVILVIRLIA